MDKNLDDDWLFRLNRLGISNFETFAKVIKELQA